MSIYETKLLSKINFEWGKLVSELYDGDPKKISVTSLAKPARAVLIQKIFPDQLRTDLDDSWAAILGTCCHELRGKVRYPGLRQEERLSKDIGGVTVSGKFDTLDSAKNFKMENGLPIVNDLKVKTKWQYNQIMRETEIGVSLLRGFTEQLSVYRWLLFCHGEKAHDVGVITYFIRDFNSNDVCPIHDMRIPLMPLDATQLFVLEKVGKIEPYLKCTDQEELPECTMAERNMFGPKMCSRYCGARSVCVYGSY